MLRIVFSTFLCGSLCVASSLAQETKCCVEGNLAHGKQTSASSEEAAKKNLAQAAVDGNLKTRWCAAGAASGQWWQVDLGGPQKVGAVRIHWEAEKAIYRYRVEGSLDGKQWSPLVDQASDEAPTQVPGKKKKNNKPQRVTGHEFAPAEARYLKVTFLGSSTGGWGSFWEFECYPAKLPPLPDAAKGDPAAPLPTLADVQVPPEFTVTMFGVPPEVNYPVCLSAAPTGELFVGCDEQGSLGKEKGRGRVVRCIDTNGDGVADKFTIFAKMDHPRGLVYDHHTLWVLHPPYLTVYFDDNRDGESDRSETLITGISTGEVAKRGADHTTNGIRMAIDGWIYIAVGDFGFADAKAADGTVLSRRGGGIVRIRPNGGEMEIFAWGLRNILDVNIDPYLNVFTRDNTNDGGGWNIRLSHIVQGGEYGYPSRYQRFADETAPPLADYGGGSGCGGLFMQDLRWPQPFADALYTCDWGRSEIYRHNLPAKGATFSTHQESFARLPRPTDLDVDGSGRMYLASWKGGNFSYGGPNVGFVAQVVPKGYQPPKFPDLAADNTATIVKRLAAESAVERLHAQREILRRGDLPELAEALEYLANQSTVPPYGRVAAIFTLKQLRGQESHPALLKLAGDAAVREFALRALTDRRSQLDGLPLAPFTAALKDENPRVRAQALVSLARLGKREAAAEILPLVSREAGDTLPAAQPMHLLPDPGRVLPHLAERALIACDAADICLGALGGPHQDGALRALRQMHSERAVSGLLQQLEKSSSLEEKKLLLSTLVRLHDREGDYAGNDWWGTRPDTSGPYYDRKPWAQSTRIAAAVTKAAADPALQALVAEQLASLKVKIAGLSDTLASAAPADEMKGPIKLPEFDKNNPNQLGNLAYEAAAQRTLAASGSADRGKLLFTQQQCVACHTIATGQTPRGPHLVDIGKRYKKPELIESILKPSAKIAQGFDSWQFLTVEGKVISGFIALESAESVLIRQENGVPLDLPKDDIEERKRTEVSMMPQGIVNNLTAEQLADLLAYLESLKSAP